MLEQSCRTDKIKTHYPTNITQGISAHPAASFPKINRYWKNTRHLERSKMYPQFTKKAKNPTASNYRPISLTVSCAKFWSILLLLAWINTSLNWTYFMKCSMASEKRDPARRNLLMKYLKTCRWANILGPISSTSLRRVFVLKTSYKVRTLKIGFHQTIELCELLTFCRIFKTNI